jgi:zinc protease
MSVRLLLLLTVLGFSQTTYAAAKIETWQTTQGSRIYYVYTESLPMVDIQMVFDAGSSRDGQQFGVASLTADVLGMGAGSWNADQIAERFESVGALFGATVSDDMTGVSLRSLTDKPLLDKALETMQVIISKPVFKDADFQREKNRTLEGLKQQEELPAVIASIAFDKKLYGDHPYAHSSSGTLKTVGNLKAADLRSFYKNYYVAANAIVVIVGNLSRQQAEETARYLLKDLPEGKKPERLPDVAKLTAASTQHIEFPSAQTHVLVGEPGIARNDPDYFSLYTGNHILGGGVLVSRLFNEIREKRGLAYHAASSFKPMKREGPFTVGLQTRNDQAEQALKVLNTSLADFVQKGPDDAELTAAKKDITGGFAMRFDTNKELASYVSMIGFYEMPLDYLDTFTQKIDKVSLSSITDAFKRHINLNTLQTVTVGNSAKTSAK